MTVVAASASPAFWDRAPRARPSGRRVLVAAAVLALVGVAAMLRLRALSAPYWIDEGISVGISSHPLGAIPGAPAPGRLAAAVLPAAARVDGALRHGPERHARAVGGPGHRLRAGRLVGGGAVRGVGRRSSPAALMALDPFVGLYADETRMYSLLLLLALLVCGAFLRAFVLRRRAIWRASRCSWRWPSTPTVGRVPRRRGGPGVAGPARRSGPPGARWPATARWPSAAPRCSSRRGCRPCSTRPPTPARRGRTARRAGR